MVARYNSCGRPTEIGRAPYKTRARLYPDSEQEFDLVWYPARDDVPFLRGPHAINSLRWEEDREDWLPLAVGEIFGTDRDYNPERGKPTALGLHTCGTSEDFAGDGRIDFNPPFVEYNPDQLPRCCGSVFESAGGVALGGSADVYGVRYGTGGFALGGVADVQTSAHITGAGGVALGGVADVNTAVQGTGGVALGGTADVFQNHTFDLNCSMAGELHPGVWYFVSFVNFFPTHAWGRFPVVGGEMYHVQGTNFEFDDSVAILFGTCDDFTELSNILNNDCHTITAPQDGWVYLMFTFSPILPGEHYIMWDHGPCA
jgi:hypothetical protein